MVLAITEIYDITVLASPSLAFPCRVQLATCNIDIATCNIDMFVI
jgi:hypothetical protein